MKFLENCAPILRFLTRVYDLIFLNMLCVLCCLPIVTAGPSITAMYYVTLRMVRGEDRGILKDFFHSFRQNLKQGMLLNLLLTAGAILLGLDLYILWMFWKTDLVFQILFVVMAMFGIVFVCICLFIYPLLAQFNNTIKGFLKNALFMSLKHGGYTLVMLLVTFTPWIVGIYVPYMLEWLIIIELLLGISTISFLLSHLFVKIFDAYIPAEEL